MNSKPIVAIALTAAFMAGCTAPAQQSATLPTLPAPTPKQTITIPADPLDALPPPLREVYNSGNYKTPVKDGFAIYLPYQPHIQPTVLTAENHITQINLASTEHITTASVGDTVRWMILAEHNYIRVKPCSQGCSSVGGIGAAASQGPVPSAPKTFDTNLRVDTDLHHYDFKLQCTGRRTAMEELDLWYPADIAAAESARAAAIQQSDRGVADPANHQLNEHYRISGPDVPWRPLKAFDNGSSEYLLFSSGAALQADMPSLYVQSGKDEEPVNYRTEGNYYITDRLYSHAVLTVGNGNNRPEVRIDATR